MTIDTRARPHLALFSLDRPALKAFSAELSGLLASNDRDGLVRALGLAGALAERVTKTPRAVDWFLRPETDPEAAPLYASLRRIAKKRALELVWTSPDASLEGRLRHFEVLRDDPEIAALVDKLLSTARLPWYLVRPGATGGWLDGAQRAKLARGLEKIAPALPKELATFAEAISGIEGDVIAHDGL